MAPCRFSMAEVLAGRPAPLKFSLEALAEHYWPRR